MRNYIRIVLTSFCCLAASCNFGANTPEPAKNQQAEKTNTATANANSAANAANEKADAIDANRANDISDAVKVTKSDCLEINTGDNEIVKNQTFPIDFAPFENSCFVTESNPEFDDPPMETEFAIYKNDRRVFDFPAQYNGVSFGCRVEAVAFEDLNDDNLKDIAIVGKCQAKTEPYNENMIYVNTGKAFTTSEDANYKLADFKKIKEITDFARKNQNIFFK